MECFIYTTSKVDIYDYIYYCKHNWSCSQVKFIIKRNSRCYFCDYNHDGFENICFKNILNIKFENRGLTYFHKLRTQPTYLFNN